MADDLKLGKAGAAEAQFTLVIRAVREKSWAASPDRRLARLLKAMLRGYGFRCVELRQDHVATENPGRGRSRS